MPATTCVSRFLAAPISIGSLLVATAASAPAAYASGAPSAGTCVDPSAEVLSIQQSAQNLYNQGFAGTPSQGISGIFTLPGRTPDSLVIMAHGHHYNSSVWQQHALDARAHGAIGVVVDYRGLGSGSANPAYAGWPAQAGAQDLVTATHYFLSRCPSIKRVVLLGVSMGGNMSGMALAADATRPGSSKPLFDYWVDVEGVTNWVETYTEAAATQNMAQGEIEAECGGKTPVVAPDCYRQRTVTARIPNIASSGVRGIAVVHSAEDGLVPYDQSREFVTAARPAGLAVDMYTVLRRSSDPTQTGQTTLLSDVNGNVDCTGTGSGAVGPLPPAVTVCDPLAGHGWEGSETQLTIATGMNLAWNFISEHPQAPANRECVVDAGAVNPLGTACTTSGAPTAAGIASRQPAATPRLIHHPAAATPTAAAPTAAPRDAAPMAVRATRLTATTTSVPSGSSQGFFAAIAAALARLAQTIARVFSG